MNFFFFFFFLFHRLQLTVQQELNEPSIRSKANVIWQEFVGDLWQRHLPHLREEMWVYNFIGQRGFQEEKDIEVSSSEAMASLLQKAADEDFEENSEASSSVKASLSEMDQSFVSNGEESWLVNAEGESKAINCKFSALQ